METRVIDYGVIWIPVVTEELEENYNGTPERERERERGKGIIRCMFLLSLVALYTIHGEQLGPSWNSATLQASHDDMPYF